MSNFLHLFFISFFIISITYSQDNSSSSGSRGSTVGTFMLGAVADVTFPFGEEFKAYSGTGYSGHIIAGYSVLNNLLLTLKIGYIKFGEQDVNFGGFAKIAQEEYSATATNSQVPVLIGIYFTPGLDPTCLGNPGSCFSGSLLNPYIGLQGGLFFKTYKLISSYVYGGLGDSYQQFSDSEEYTESSTIFGIVPTAGTFYSLSDKVRLSASIEYNYLFEEADVDAANISFLSINFGAVYNFN
ncbi:MAG: hypothetical protein OQK57_02565 [Ignavibacteriaceae bacterium]|nr:hypothetical protein [Ignavibacteriaceae bacterium]